MSISTTLTGDWLVNLGNKNSTSGTGNLGTYATNGVAIVANKFGLSLVEDVAIDPSSGYVFEYVKSTGKVKAYYSNGTFPSHTHDVKLIGGQASATTTVVAYYATDILGKQAATDKTIAGADSATKGGVVATSAVLDAASTEVADTTDLSGITFNWRAFGK